MSDVNPDDRFEELRRAIVESAAERRVLHVEARSERRFTDIDRRLARG